jgi:hypothetical protein
MTLIGSIDYFAQPSKFTEPDGTEVDVYHVFDAFVTYDGQIEIFRAVKITTIPQTSVEYKKPSLTEIKATDVHVAYRTRVLPIIKKLNLNIWFAPGTKWEYVQTCVYCNDIINNN